MSFHKPGRRWRRITAVIFVTTAVMAADPSAQTTSGTTVLRGHRERLDAGRMDDPRRVHSQGMASRS